MNCVLVLCFEFNYQLVTVSLFDGIIIFNYSCTYVNRLLYNIIFVWEFLLQGYRSSNGVGVPQSCETALSYYSKVAEKGMFHLKHVYNYYLI